MLDAAVRPGGWVGQIGIAFLSISSGKSEGKSYSGSKLPGAER
jgi:hypothetical protein